MALLGYCFGHDSFDIFVSIEDPPVEFGVVGLANTSLAAISSSRESVMTLMIS